jgi:hypothetical protein
VGTPQLAKHHRDKLSPAAKAAGMALGFGFLNQQLKFAAREKLENLTEHATESIHVGPPVSWVLWGNFARVSQTVTYRRLNC